MLRSALILSALAPLAACVRPEDLQRFFSSSTGLSMPASDARALAAKEAGFLTDCGVTVPMLQALRDTLYKPNMVDMALPEVRRNLLPLAYQHADSQHLLVFFQTLNSSVGLPLADAQEQAIVLASRHAEPYLLGPLFTELYHTVNMAKQYAQRKAVEYNLAGADAGKLRQSYQSHPDLDSAAREAVNFNLLGLEKRYAKDVGLYTAPEFQKYYSATWLAEWLAAPKEKRTAQDGRDYRASEFYQYFGSSWNTKWAASPTAKQTRIANDGKTYDMQGFRAYYKDDWQARWAEAYEVARPPAVEGVVVV